MLCCGAEKMRTLHVMMLLVTVVSTVADVPLSGYLFTMPFRMWERSEERFCLVKVNEDNKAFRLVLKFQNKNDEDQSTMMSFSWDPAVDTDWCFQFTTPSAGDYNVSAQVVDADNASIVQDIGYVNGNIRAKSQATLIQSDKPVYKPGQTVKFRIMTMDYELKPRVGMISKVYIENPGDVRVRQWSNVNASIGLVSLEMKLSDDPLQGMWKIKTLIDGVTTKQEFEVKEYVLPKFEVTITPPGYLLPTTETIEGQICARYTYGQPVKGMLDFSVWYGGSYYYSYYRSPDEEDNQDECSRNNCYKTIVEIDGCYTFSIPAEEIGYPSSRYGGWGQALVVKANVTEEGTGIKLGSEHKGPSMSRSAFSLQFEIIDEKYFKPAFPHRETIIAKRPDGTPASGEIIEVTAKNWRESYYVRRNVTTDENGKATFVVTNVPDKVTNVQLEAKAVMYRRSDYRSRMYEPSAYSHVKRWFSPSNSYIKIQKPTTAVPCKQSMSFDVFYNTPANTNYRFYFMVMSNNRVMYTGQKENRFYRRNVDTSMDIDEVEVMEPFVPRDRYYYRPLPRIPRLRPIVIVLTNETSNASIPEPVPTPPAQIIYGNMMSVKNETKYRTESVTFRCEIQGIPIPTYEWLKDDRLIRDDGRRTRIEKTDWGSRLQIINLRLTDRGEYKCRVAGNTTSSTGVLTVRNERPPFITRMNIRIPISAKMAPDAQLLVYYIRDDMETVSDQIEFSVEKCFDNEVDLRFSEDKVLPGNQATLQLRAAPRSYCGIGVVDKSIDLMGPNHKLTPSKVFDMIPKAYNYYYWYSKNQEYCRNKYPNPDGKSAERYYYFDINTVDAIKAFRDMGLATFTDLTLETRPCEKQEYYYRRRYYSVPSIERASIADDDGPEALMPDSIQTTANRNLDTPLQVGATNKEASASVRSFFPETWLWDIEMVGDSGTLEINKEIPHTITEWLGSAICANTEVGVGVSQTAKIKAFQPFFLSFTLPYSAIRNEVVPVLLSVANYLEECLVMLVSLSDSDDFELHTGDRTSKHCVCGGERETIKYYVIPKTLGKIKIQAAAQSIAGDGTCGNKVVDRDNTGVRDAVRRDLLVEAEGVEKEYTFSSYICSQGGSQDVDIILPLPSTDLVPDSARGKISVIGDIMGPALSNLHHLFRMPYGCGEQNMASWAPNIFALQYLSNTNQLADKVEQEAKNYMRVGYQRQLNYRQQDYSYSAWGGAESGSTWLTAFVVKCLGQSAAYIDVEPKDISDSVKWFLSKQLENGCFPQIGYTHSYYLKGGIASSNNEASLTAFVLISVLESGQLDRRSEAVVNAIHCLDVQEENDTYTLALMAYAYTLYDVNYPQRQVVMETLEERALFKGDGQLKYWARDDEGIKESPHWYWYRAPSAEVEITAYVLLSLLYNAEQSEVVQTRTIVTWLSKQRNQYGGFSSTQDTVVALQALSMYATIVYQGGIDLSLVVGGNENTETSFLVDDKNSLVLQTHPLENLPDTLFAQMTGVGCALLQASVKYNIFEQPTGPAFDATVNVYRSKEFPNLCSRRTISICATYTGPGGISRMAIVEVKMVTGWIPVKSTLTELIEGSLSSSLEDAKKFEVDGNKVSIYFEKFDRNGRCFYFDVEQEIELSDPEKASVKMYDYYETDLEGVFQYKIESTCSRNLTLPYPEPDIFFCGMRTAFLRVSSDVVTSDEVEESTRPTTCPVCEENTMKAKSDDFHSLVCSAEKIYKIKAGRKGKYSVKLYADLRTKRKTVVRKFASMEFMSTCDCNVESETEKRYLLFTDNNTFNATTTNFVLDERTTIVPWSKKFEGLVRRKVVRKRKGCN